LAFSDDKGDTAAWKRFDGFANYPACRDYVARATARPSFLKVNADQMAHFAAVDESIFPRIVE